MSLGEGEGRNAAYLAGLGHRVGLYKGWGQFKRDGRARVVPLVLSVE